MQEYIKRGMMNFKCETCGKNELLRTYITRWCLDCLRNQIDCLWVFSSDYTDCVYGLYDENGKLLYIGVTNNPLNRLHSHKELKTFSRMRIVSVFKSREEADNFEKYAIHKRKPPLNIKYDLDWTEVKPSWDDDMKWFGKVSKVKTKKVRVYSEPKKKKKKPVESDVTPWVIQRCTRCGQMVGRKSKTIVDGQIVHAWACSAPKVISPEEKAEKKKAKAKAKAQRKKKASTRNGCFFCGNPCKGSNYVGVMDKAKNKALVHNNCLENFQKGRKNG